MATRAEPFRLHVDQSAIDDLRARLALTRFPDYAAFPREILRPPRSVAEKTYTDIRRWTDMPRGGHFAAMEEPAALAREIVEFFRPLRPR
jgi:pimeloyl-ACP methyl ester carboxylesterase